MCYAEFNSPTEFISPTLILQQNYLLQQCLYKLAIPRRVEAHVRDLVIRIQFFERSTLLGCFHPQAEVKDPQPSILKQKAGIPGTVVLNRSEEVSTSSPASDRDLFSPAGCCYPKLPSSSATSHIHTSFTKCHIICIHNAYNILIYFEGVMTKCISCIMTLHKN